MTAVAVRRRRWALGGSVLAMSLLCAWWLLRSSGPATPAPVAPDDGRIVQGHIYTGVVEEPRRINPFTTSEGVARRYVLGFTHDTLLDTDPQDGKLRGALARSWRVHEDGLTVDFELRPDVVFADGSPMTPADVLFTWEVARSPDLVLGTLCEGLGLVERAEWLGPPASSLRVVLRQRHFAAVQAVGESWIVTQRSFWLRRVAELAAADGLAPPPEPGTAGFGALIARIDGESGPGTGPYRLGGDPDGRSQWRPRTDLLLLRNERNWRRAAIPGVWNLEGVRLLFRNQAAAYNALLAGDIDWYSFPDSGEILRQRPELAERYRRHVYDARNLGVFLVVWNCERPALADARVRRALGMLFDREAIVGQLMDGCGRPAAAFGKVGSPDYPPDLAPVAYDPGQARALLRAAGFDAEAGRPLRVQICCPADGLMRQMVELAVDAGSRIGVAIELRLLDWNALTTAVERRDFDGVLRQQGFRNWIDPYDTFHSRGGLNDARWRSEQADALLGQARVEADDAVRAAVYQRFHRLLAQEQPVALLVHPLAAVLIDARLRAATPGPLGLWPERFWMPLASQRK